MLKTLDSWGVPRLESYYSRETRVRGELHSITSLSGGELGILTSVGLFTFDGTNWDRIPGINRPTHAIRLPDGRTIVAFVGGIMALSPDDLGDYATELLTPPEKYTAHVHEIKTVAAARGHIFGLTGNDLIQVAPDGSIREHKFSTWSAGIFAIGDELYALGGITSLLNRWDWETESLVDASIVLNDSVYEWMIASTPRAAGGVWIQTDQNKIIGFDGRRSWLWAGSAELARRGARITSFAELDDDQLAIGTESMGVLVFEANGELLYQIDKERGLDDPHAIAVGKDSQNGLWVGTRNSLTRIDKDTRTLVFDNRHGIASRAKAIAFYNDRLYIGAAGGLYVSQDNPDSMDQLFVRLPEPRDVSAFLIHDGLLFVGGTAFGVVGPDGHYRLLSTEGSLTLLQPSQHPDVVLTGNVVGAYLFRKIGDEWINQGPIPGESTEIFRMAESQEGAIFGSLGTDRIARIWLDETSPRLETLPIPFKNPGVWSQVARVGDDVYINSSPSLRWDSTTQSFVADAKMIYYVGAPPFGFDQVYGESPENAYVCVSESSGITLPRPPAAVIGAISSLGNSLDTRAQCIAYDGQGNVWAGGSFGVLRATPPKPELQANIAPPRIHKLISLHDGKELPIANVDGKPLVLEPDQNSLRIAVEFPNFTAAQHNQYQIAVTGIDVDWTGFTLNPFRELTNLAPGPYTLHIGASDASGKGYYGSDYLLIVKAPWYERSWAYACYAVGSVLLVIGIVYYYNRVQIRRSRVLQKLVDDRTQEIQEKNLALQEQAATLERQNGELEEKSEELQTATQSLSETLQRLQDMQDQLVAAARRAGKAEIATNVLHNVGNVLNSINVSLTVVGEKVASSKTANLCRLADIVEARLSDIAVFLTQDPKGRVVPDYLIQIARTLRQENVAIAYEIETMEADVGHVKRIIAAQQMHASNQRMITAFRLSELCDSAFKMLGDSNDSATFEVVNEVPASIEIRGDKHRTLEILLNLVANARDAVLETPNQLGVITLSAAITSDGGNVVLEVADNGGGVDPANLPHLFTHGFTTKPQGHGFGLHGAANTAQALGGRLELASPGKGLGAVARLTLPLEISAAEAIAEARN